MFPQLSKTEFQRIIFNVILRSDCDLYVWDLRHLPGTERTVVRNTCTAAVSSTTQHEGRVSNNALCSYKLVRDFKCLCHKKKLRIQTYIAPISFSHSPWRFKTLLTNVLLLPWRERKESAAVLPERMTGTSAHRGAAQSLGWIFRALLPPECHPTPLQNTTDSFLQPSAPLHLPRVVTITLTQLQLAGPRSFHVASEPIPLAGFSPSHCKRPCRTH